MNRPSRPVPDFGDCGFRPDSLDLGGPAGTGVGVGAGPAGGAAGLTVFGATLGADVSFVPESAEILPEVDGAMLGRIVGGAGTFG